MIGDPLLWDATLPWDDLATATGNARDVPAAIRDLWQATSDEEAQAAYWRLDNVVVVQGSVFHVAPHLVEVLVRIAIAGGFLQRRWSLELLLQLAGGWTDPSEQARLGRDLAAECRLGLRRSVEALYLLATDEDHDVRELAVEIIANVEDLEDVFERRVSWIVSQTADADHRSFVEGILSKGLREH